jgi:hypothetical protein
LVLKDDTKVKLASKEVALKVFLETSPGLWNCKLCPQNQMKTYKCMVSKNRYSNLIKHVRVHVSDRNADQFFEYITSKCERISFKSIIPFTFESIFKWIDFIVSSLQLLSIVEDNCWGGWLVMDQIVYQWKLQKIHTQVGSWGRRTDERISQR